MLSTEGAQGLIYFCLGRGDGREKERERDIHGRLPITCHLFYLSRLQDVVEGTGPRDAFRRCHTSAGGRVPVRQSTLGHVHCPFLHESK